MNADAGANAGQAMQPCDFHLVESPEGWLLTIQVTERLQALIAGTTADVPAAGAPSPIFTVHVEPNLLPGGPFEATAVAAGAPTELPATH